ncbi:hypothetical protein NDU88_005204 [Pleurodeles waltl]|uniref:Uncharacterized protein n=1 Tax=Pleurodeles waltl TaxID=8319 RepID=A0AAV7LWR2_PLEWA|nr:hypothetical protein NDU88_005204 [Pleurodeles waltl]
MAEQPAAARLLEVRKRHRLLTIAVGGDRDCLSSNNGATLSSLQTRSAGTSITIGKTRKDLRSWKSRLPAPAKRRYDD